MIEFVPDVRDGVSASADYQITVSEHFGPTFQGEGPSLGRPCYFIRLGGCNLHCSWCDTPYTWRWSLNLPHDRDAVYDPRKELKRYTTTDLLEIVKNQPTRMVVITGGEPLLQGSRLVSLLFELLNAGYRIEIETNGTILPAWSKTSLGLELLEDIHFNVSPKLSNSGNDVLKRINPKAMDWFVANPNAVFKFVCLNEKDLKEIEAYQYDFEIPSSRIYVMPEGRSNSEIQNHLGLLASSVLRKEWNLTTRLQVVLYGDRRGV